MGKHGIAGMGYHGMGLDQRLAWVWVEVSTLLFCRRK
jgi:hypothetical protein